jgi:hypothetical protein
MVNSTFSEARILPYLMDSDGAETVLAKYHKNLTSTPCPKGRLFLGYTSIIVRFNTGLVIKRY